MIGHTLLWDLIQWLVVRVSMPNHRRLYAGERFWVGGYAPLLLESFESGFQNLMWCVESLDSPGQSVLVALKKRWCTLLPKHYNSDWWEEKSFNLEEFLGLIIFFKKNCKGLVPFWTRLLDKLAQSGALNEIYKF